jgi:hypothetical protein
MALIGEGMESQGAPEEFLQGLQGVMQQFGDLIASLGGGAEQSAEQPPAQAKSRAVPVQESQGKPVGPAGV